MRAEDLDHSELLQLDPEAGTIRFAGQRALLVDAVAMGLLRKYLVENLGTIAARAVLTQFGFANGWRMADAIRAEFPLDDLEWRKAGLRIHALTGLFRVAVDNTGPASEHHMTFESSYEAEQHLLHFGRSVSPECWTISGLISGYLSRAAGEEIFVLEERCVAKGDAACHFVGRTKDRWGSDRIEDIEFFQQQRLRDCLDVSLEHVLDSLRRADRKLRERKRTLERAVPEVEAPLDIVARSQKMRQLIDLARRVAVVDSTVLITGESGAGKERIAQLVHDASPRAGGPFVAVNCGAIAETLLESELFGHARGSFTGATQDRVGLFEAANHGTLLLDEVGEVSPAMQVKLLRVLQEREIRRVGESKSRKIDVRVIAATNRDLAHGVAGGGFRQDLYYRLKVVELHVPPLRERREDIMPLARVLLAQAAIKMKRKIAGLAPAAADQLLRYDWPGNVRELENAMERAAALARGERADIEDMPEEVRTAPPKSVLSTHAVNANGAVHPDGTVQSLADVERTHILATLALNGGNRAHTSEQLGIGSATLYRKLRSYGLEVAAT